MKMLHFFDIRKYAPTISLSSSPYSLVLRRQSLYITQQRTDKLNNYLTLVIFLM